jgi:hypothetical protein
MRKKRYGVEQVIGVLQQAHVGVPVAGGDPQGRNRRANVLPLEGEVCRPGGRRACGVRM